MLNARWSRLACRKPLVTIRYHSPPSEIAGPNSPPSLPREPPNDAAPLPLPSSARKTITLTASRA
jgi:hypothetical protein